MYFINKKNRLKLYITNFIKDYKFMSAVPSIIVVDNCVFPYDVSGISMFKSTCFIKGFNEYKERSKIGFNTFSNKKTWFLTQNGISKIQRNIIGYGFSKNYGELDTTGSSSGRSSKKLKEKSLMELIEKNEIMIFWYGSDTLNNYSVIPKNFKVLKKFNVEQIETFIFYSKNISNMHTAIVLGFIDKKIVCSGVNCNFSLEKAVEEAMKEAISIGNIYLDKTYSPYYSLSLKDHSEIYNYTKEKYEKRKDKFLSEKITNVNKISLNKDFREIFYAGLNINSFSNELTIRCFSKSLVNCLPRKEYLQNMYFKKVINRFLILENLDKVPNIPIL